VGGVGGIYNVDEYGGETSTLDDTGDTTEESGRDLDSLPIRTDISDTVFMVNGGR
jgi:hypothetical protein